MDRRGIVTAHGSDSLQLYQVKYNNQQFHYAGENRIFADRDRGSSQMLVNIRKNMVTGKGTNRPASYNRLRENMDAERPITCAQYHLLKRRQQ